jgi:hypothetical protein
VDPRGISGVCRLRRLDKREVFSRMSVARAFTAYQLDSLINDGLEEMLAGGEVSAVVVSCLLDPFLDRDMPWPESLQLVERCVKTLKGVAADGGIPVVVTNYGLAKVRRSRELVHLMYDAPDRVLRLEVSGGNLLVILPRSGRHAKFRPAPPHQAILDHYFRLYDPAV